MLKKKNLILAICILAFGLLPYSASSETLTDVQPIVADNPKECLALEGILLDGENYILVDGRSNTGKVKRVQSDGTISAGIISSFPLPDASSLPCDAQPSPFGNDRIVLADNKLYSVPAPWAGASAEIFDSRSGSYVGIIPFAGFETQGFAVNGDGVWAVSDISLINLSAQPANELRLDPLIQHIDCAASHPLGFIVYSAPDLLLVETTGIVRWRLGLDGVVDGFISPIDIASSPNGSIAVVGAVCSPPDPAVLQEYADLRAEGIQQGNSDALLSLEEALRANFTTGWVLLFVAEDGTVTDAIDLNVPPVGCAIDESGRVHLLTQGESSWKISIVDPRLNQGFPQCEIPFGTPTMVSPHAIAVGPGGSLYWDDIIVTDSDTRWGILKSQQQSSGLFNLGAGTGTSVVYSQPATESLAMANALAVGQEGDIWIALQEFLLNQPLSGSADEDAPLGRSAVLHISDDGVLVRRDTISDGTLTQRTPLEITPAGDSVQTIWSTLDQPEPVVLNLSRNGLFTPVESFPWIESLTGAKIQKAKTGYVGWFDTQGESNERAQWYRFGDYFANASAIDRLNALGCRLLGSDPSRSVLYVTIDDGEIFRLDSESLRVTGVWANRFATGAPGYPLDNGVWTSQGLAVLDREHRAALCIPDDILEIPPLMTDVEVTQAIDTIKTALGEYKTSYGSYPAFSPGLLGRILDPSELETVGRCLIGGRIYWYETSQTGFRFVAWSAAADQPALVCSQDSAEPVY